MAFTYYKPVTKLLETSLKNKFQFNNYKITLKPLTMSWEKVCTDSHRASIKLEAVIRDKKYFVDTIIFKNPSDPSRLLSKVYFKETGTHQLLDKIIILSLNIHFWHH